VADGGSVVDSPDYDLFISYARADNKTEFVSRLFDTIYEDFRGFPPSRSSVGGCIVAGRSGA
jgi:hypothetical protein